MTFEEFHRQNIGFKSSYLDQILKQLAEAEGTTREQLDYLHPRFLDRMALLFQRAKRMKQFPDFPLELKYYLNKTKKSFAEGDLDQQQVQVLTEMIQLMMIIPAIRKVYPK